MMLGIRHRFVAWLVALATVCGSGFAAAQNELMVDVVSVKSDDALDQAEALTQVLRKAVRDAPGWGLAESRQSLEFLALKMGCKEPIDAACETRIADVLQTDRFLWSVISFADDEQQNVTGTLNFFVRGQGTKSTEISYSANLTDATADALVSIAKKAVDEVTGGAPKGKVKVTAGGIAGQIFIDGEPKGALPAEGAEFPLAAGEHRIVVKAPGYADAEGTVTIKPAGAAELDLLLVVTEEASDTDWRMIGGFASLGVGVAAGAVGLWAALEVNGIQSDAEFETFRQTLPNTQDVCDAAATSTDPTAPGVVDKCDRAGTMEIMQAVMFPVAGVAAGVGIFLIGTSSLFASEEGEASAWQVQPILTPTVQAMAVEYTF